MDIEREHRNSVMSIFRPNQSSMAELSVKGFMGDVVQSSSNTPQNVKLWTASCSGLFKSPPTGSETKVLLRILL